MHESGLSLAAAQSLLLVLGVVLSSGVLSSILAQRLKIADIVLFLFVGVLLGPEVLGLITLKADSPMNELMLIFGAAYILFDGGTSLKLNILKEVWVTVVMLATVGVAITALLAGLAAHWIIGLPLATSLLLGATISATDPASLIPVFRQVSIRERLAQAVMSESAFNDAAGAILTISLFAVVMGHGTFSLSETLVSLLIEAVMGVVIGGALGYAAVFFIGHRQFGFLREYMPIMSLIVVCGAYLMADGMHASGFMSVFIAGVMVGNSEVFGYKLDQSRSEKLGDFMDTTSLIMRMVIFMLLGAQVNFQLLAHNWLPSLLVVIAFIFVVRPLTVFLCVPLDRRARWSLRELLFMCWTRETGVIPGVLAGLLETLRVPHADMIASVTFVTILTTIILQTSTTGWLARKLDVAE